MIPVIIISVYLMSLLLLGVASARLFKGTSSDYFLASRGIGPFLLLMSLFGTTMTAFALVGSTGESFKEGIGVYGMMASWSGIVHSAVFFLIGIKLWSFGKKYGYVTQIQFFRDRFESDGLGLLLFPIVVGLVIPYLLIGVMAGGTVVESITEGAFPVAFAETDGGVPKAIASAVICGVVLIYVFFGGIRGTAWANAFQTIVFMILGVVTFVVVSSRLPDAVSVEGGGARAVEGKPSGVIAASDAVLDRKPSKFKRRIDVKDREAFENALARWETLAEYNFAVKRGLVALTPEQVEAAHGAFKPRMPGWQRHAAAAFSRKNELFTLDEDQRREAHLLQDDRVIPDDVRARDDWRDIPFWRFKRAAGSGKKGLKVFAARIESGEWTHKKAIGVYKATSWRPTEPHTVRMWQFLSYLLIPLSVGMFPHLFQHWLTAKSAKSFRLSIIAHPIFIMIVWTPCVLIGAWATAATLDGRPLIPEHFNPNGVLAFMVVKLCGPVLAGLLTTGILAAIMSSLDSQFLSIGSMFTNDIVGHYMKKGSLSDKQRVMIGRAFVIAIVVLTYLLSLGEVRRVFTLGIWCFSGFASLFPLVFFAVYWRRMTKAGAYAGIVTTAVVWCLLFRDSGYAANPHYLLIDGVGLMPVTAMVGATTLAVIVVSLLTRPPSAKTVAKFFAPTPGLSAHAALPEHQQVDA